MFQFYLAREDPVLFVPHHPLLNCHYPMKLGCLAKEESRFRAYLLNDMLLVGPDLLASLIGTLLSYRENKLEITAEIEEMFL